MQLPYSSNNLNLNLFIYREPINFETEHDGFPVVVSMTYRESFSLDEQMPEQRKHMDKLLNYVLTIVKKALFEERYNQIGRLPKFFQSDDKVKIN